jgi:Tol biopolymer transport system component
MLESIISRTGILTGALAFVLGTLALSRVTAETNGTQAQLMELTGGKRVKVAWLQGTEQDVKTMYYDTADDVLRVLPFEHDAGPTTTDDISAPLFTSDGRYVLTSNGRKEHRKVMMYDTKTKAVRTLATGPGNYLIAVWTDPKTRRTWAYVNSNKDKGEAWNVAEGGPIYRYPIDNPQARELFWDRTSSHFYLMFSEDGTRACFEPSWANIGQLKLTFKPDGTVDQDKSEYKTFGGGCFPSMAPDNSYKIFRLEGDHKAVSMCDADNTNQRKVVTSTGPIEGATWLTRWSTNPRYLTCMAPDGPDAKTWIGRFDKDFTKIENWVRVAPEKGPKCWLSQAWVEK